MFHENVLKFGVQKNPESNVLGSFPQDARRIFAFHTTSLLLSEAVPPSELSSSSHVAFMMECLGQSFNLPIGEDTKGIIESATEIYRRWLFNIDGKRPKPVENDEQQFFRNCMRHFSLLFNPKLSQGAGSQESVVEVHAKLCSTVLSILKQLNLEVGKSKFTTQTWEEEIKIMLGIADSVFVGKDSSVTLGGKIGALLLQVLLEVFLISHTKNDSLWQKLRTQIGSCIEKKPTAKHWTYFMAGVSKRVLRLLYGANEGADTVVLTGGALQPTTLELADDFVYYIWYRLLYIVGALESIESASVYLDFMKGVTTLVDIYLQVGASAERQLRPSVLDGNTILNLFGAFLFDGIQKCTKQGFEQGKAEGISTLCKIFLTKKHSSYLPKYYARFYEILAESLKNDSLRPVVLINCKNLFQAELRGGRTLIPYFLFAIEQTYKMEKNYDAKLRAACIHILGYAICLSNQFSDTKFVYPIELKVSGKLVQYSDIKKYLVELFTEGLKREEDKDNRHTLLATVVSFIYEHLHDTSTKEVIDFRTSFINTLLRELATVSSQEWPFESKITLLKVVGELASLGSNVIVTRELATGLAIQMATFMSVQLNRKGDKHVDEIVAEAFTTLLKWVMVGQWLMQSDTCLKKVLALIEQAINTRPSRSADAAEVLLVYLLNWADNFPPPTGPGSLFAHCRESDLADLRRQRYISTYLFEQTVVSVIRGPRDPFGANGVTLILHNTPGRNVWTMAMHYAPPSELPKVAPIQISAKSDMLPYREPKNDPNTVKELGSLSDAKVKSEQQWLMKQCSTLISDESSATKKKAYGLEIDISCVQPALPELNDDTDTTVTRLWLSNFGLIHSLGWCSRMPLDSTQQELLKKLDTVKEREVHNIDVLYSRRGAPYDSEKTGVSQLCADFLSQIGWRGHHNNFKYFSCDCEVSFTLTTAERLSETPARPTGKSESSRDLVLSAAEVREKDEHYVLVTWAEDCIELYDFFSLKMYHAWVNIVILPLASSGLFLIRVYQKDGLPRWGPLQDEMVVSKDSLPALVRETAVNASIACRAKEASRKIPYLVRKAAVHDFVAKHKSTPTHADWWGAQFLEPAAQIEKEK